MLELLVFFALGIGLYRVKVWLLNRELDRLFKEEIQPELDKVRDKLDALLDRPPTN